MTKTADNNDAPARRAALGTLLSLLLRILSFGCTQWTLRVLDPAALGQASIQLELILTTVLFVSREGFRLALTRVEWKSHSIVNVAWLSIPSVSLASSLALVRHVHLQNTSRDFYLAGILYILSSLVEGSAEPAILTCLHRLDVTTRATAEGIATLFKTFTLVICLSQPWIARDWAVTAFGVSQLAFAVVLFLVAYVKTWSILQWPKLTKDKTSETKDHKGFLERNFDRRTCWLTVVFTFQGLFKHALTEGDKIVLTQLEDDYHQGVYSMGLHFGGMAARILLQPVEENARLLWSRQAGTMVPASGGEDPLEQSYTVLVKLVMYIGLLFATVAVNYTSVLLKVVGGPKWGENDEATQVLSAFCVYTALLAVNGTTEAFVYGVAASGKEVGGLSVAHICVGIAFYGLAPVLVSQMGTVGLVAANGVAMVLRSMYSLRFAAHFFTERQKSSSMIQMGSRLLKRMVPHGAVLLAFGLASGFTRLSLGRLQVAEMNLVGVGLTKQWLLQASQHVAVGVVCILGVASASYRFESDLGRSIRSMLRKKQD